MIPGWAARYIGLPFIDGGRDFSGVDCEGLCRMVMREHAGAPPLPDYGMLSADGLVAVARAIGSGSALPPWTRVETPKPFDWAIMTGRDKVDGSPRTLPCHLGIMLTERIVLHVEKATRSVAVPIDHPLIRHRVRWFVRHEALA